MGKINEKWGSDIAVMDCGHRLVPVPLDKEVGDEYDCILCAELQDVQRIPAEDKVEKPPEEGKEKESKMEDNAPWVTTTSIPEDSVSIWVWRKGETPIPGIFKKGIPKPKFFRHNTVFLLDGGESRFDSFHSWKYLTPPNPPLGLYA